MPPPFYTDTSRYPVNVQYPYMGGWRSEDIAKMNRLGPKRTNRYGNLGPSPATKAKIDALFRSQAGVGGPRGAKPLTEAQMIQQYQDMLTKQQKGVLDVLLADSERRRQGEMASLAGFGAALQGYSHDLWGQTNQAYRDAAAQQQSMAQGLGGQVGSGIASARAQQAALAGSLNQGEGGFADMPTAEAGAAQVASEGGKDSGGMMGAVGTAWGGYGATRPEYIGFMTGQNQMQLAREGIEADRDIRSKFLELGMDNPQTAIDMFSKLQENKRQNVSTALAQQTLQQNLTIQRAKLKQDWAEARMKAKTSAAKLAVDKRFKQLNYDLDQQAIGIDQQNATSRGVSAQASATRAQTAADQAAWERTHPEARGTPEKYATGSYNQKVASAMYNAHNLFDDSGQTKAVSRADYAFKILWPQMAPYVDAKNKKRAQNLLRQRLINAAKAYKAKPKTGGASDFSSAPNE